MLISGAGNKEDFASSAIGGTPSMEDIVQKVAELEYLEEIQVYKQQRSSEYPDFGSQLDYIYHNGVDSWKTNIVDPVKAKYAKVEIDTDELDLRKATALAEYQLKEYTKAMSRLSQYQVALGREEVTEETVVGTRPVLDENNETVLGSEGQVTHEDIVEDIVVVTSIDPVDATIEQTTHDEDGVATTTTVENPLITQDNAERAEAQAVVDATPQSVIDTYNE